MTDAAQPEAAQGQLAILMAEYQTLRAEVIQRIGSAAALVGFVGAGAAFVVSSAGGATTWIAAGIVGVLLLGVWASYLLSLGALARRLRHLESVINEVARTAYQLAADAQLLGWESGLARGGGWLRRLVRAIGADV